jgi:hypothetical protein
MFIESARFGFFEANSILSATARILSGILQTHFPYSHQLMKNKLSVALFTAAGYNFNRKVIYSYFAPGIDVDSSLLLAKTFISGLFLSRKNQFQKKYHVVRYVVQPEYSLT